LLAGAIVDNKYIIVRKIHSMKLIKVTFFILGLNY